MTADERIGPYRILSVLGEGGMGVVYEAEQVEPVRRRVALKVIARGLNTKEVVARFEAERQALALMDDPRIARVYDGGETGDGMPYFAMELVSGEPLDQFCDRRQLTVRERLGLLAEVCDAVHHAHQKGVIHRDLKPSNILVDDRDGRPQPKVIDFGIAKAAAAGQRLTDRTLLTSFTQVLGTPVYMSPEQADVSSFDIDTRTDVYTLGVLLYELLAGCLPFEEERFEHTSFSEIERILWEEDPPPPGKRLAALDAERSAAVAERRQTTPAKLLAQVTGELGWITGRAMDKERARRYDSAGAFAADLRRYLADEPVEASPVTTAYRVRKFARRHRYGLAVAAGFAILLVAGTAVSTWQAVRARAAEKAADAERREIKRQFDVNQRLFEFVVLDMLGSANVNHVADPDLKVRTVVDRAAAAIDTKFTEELDTRANLHEIVGRIYEGLGERESASHHLREAIRLGERAWGPAGHRTLPSAWATLSLVAAQRHEFEEAEELARRAWEAARALSTPSPAHELQARFALAGALRGQGRHADARPVLEECLAQSDEIHGPSDPMTYNVLTFLTDSVRQLGDEAALARYTALGRERVPGVGDDAELGKSDLTALGNRGLLLMQEEKFAEAIPLLERERGRLVALVGENHPDTLTQTFNLAVCRIKLGEMGKAHELLRVAVDGYRETLGEANSGYLDTLEVFAGVCRALGRWGEGLGAQEELVRGLLAAHGVSDWRLEPAYEKLAALLDFLGRTPELSRVDELITGEQPWPPGRTLVLVPRGSEWDYADSQEPPAGPSGWSRGRAPLGYGDDTLATEIGFGGDPANKFARAFFQRQFELGAVDLARAAGLKLRLRYDDRAVVSLNGHGLHGDEPGRSADRLGERLYFVTTADAAALVEGTNLIEATVLQARPDSSDLVFDLQLEALLDEGD